MKPLYGKSAAIHLASPSNRSGTFGHDFNNDIGSIRSPKKFESTENANKTHLVMIEDVHMPLIAKKITEEVASSARQKEFNVWSMS